MSNLTQMNDTGFEAKKFKKFQDFMMELNPSLETCTKIEEFLEAFKDYKMQQKVDRDQYFLDMMARNFNESEGSE